MAAPFQNLDDLQRRHAASLEFISRLASIERSIRTRVERGDDRAVSELESIVKRRRDCEFDAGRIEASIQDMMAGAQ